MKCVIAAGGLGTRLQGFRQNDKTKILLEVNGVPMINRQIYQINQWGIEAVSYTHLTLPTMRTV